MSEDGGLLWRSVESAMREFFDKYRPSFEQQFEVEAGPGDGKTMHIIVTPKTAEDSLRARRIASEGADGPSPPEAERYAQDG